MDEWNAWNAAARGWSEDILKILLKFGIGYTGRANGKTKAQQDAMDEEIIKRETKREVVTGRRFLRTTTLVKIQEGEFEEIEDAESGETSVRELADQAADQREEILSDEADEGRVQGGSEETVCGLRDREEEPDDGGGSD